jgi:Tol biopolymer transport system component
MKFIADFHVHSKYSRATSTTRKDTRKRLLKLMLGIVLLITVFSTPVRAWMAEWATYKRPALNPTETKVVFESCYNVEQPECGDSLKDSDIFLVDINTKELRSLTFDMENFWLSPDKSKILLQTHYGLYFFDIVNKTPPKEIFNRFPSGNFDYRINPIIMVSWAPDSKKFLFIRALGFDGKRVSSIIDAGTFEETILKVDLLPCALAWHPNSNEIFFDQGGDVNCIDLSDERTFVVLSGYPDTSCSEPIISPGGDKVLYKADSYFKFRFIGSIFKTIFAKWVELPDWATKVLNEAVWHGDTALVNQMQYILLDGPISGLRFIWSQDGTRILIKDKYAIWLYVIADSSFVPVHYDFMTISEMVWSPNKDDIFFISQYQKDTNQDGKIDKTFGNLNVVNLKNNSFKTVLPEIESLRDLVFSSDGSLLAYETGRNIWILNTTTFRSYLLTTSGGTKPQWLVDNEKLLLENNKSLYTIDKNGQNLARLTVAKGREPGWLDDKEIVIRSGDEYCKMAIDKLEVKEQTTPFKTIPISKSKKYEVYVTDSKFGMQPWDVSEIWIKEINTNKTWKIKEAWKNY